MKCTIKEFNDYRQWIRKLKLDAIDQDWHLKKSGQPISKTHTNNEAAQLTKQRQERAKELYAEKQTKQEKDRKRLIVFQRALEIVSFSLIYFVHKSP